MTGRHKQVRIAIVIQIHNPGAPTNVASLDSQPRGCCLVNKVSLSIVAVENVPVIGECSVAVVSIKPVPARGQAARPARHGNPQPDAAAVLAGCRSFLKGKPHVVGDEKVEMTVAIKVHETATGAPKSLLAPQSRGLGYVGEGAVAIIAVEEVLPKPRNENVVKAVVIVIANANAASPTNRAQSGFFRDICESAIAIVLVKAIGRALGSAFQARSRQNENVHPPVVVVVNEGAAATSRLENVLRFLAAAVDDRRTQTRVPAHIHEITMERPAGGSRSW